MIVRLKLDRCGIKLSLRQWTRFKPIERALLASGACDGPAEIAAFRHQLVNLIARRSGDAVKELAIDTNPSWAYLDEVPDQIIRHAATIGVDPPLLEDWGALSPLQRFSLLKLTRDNHDNVNFLPAMREFGLKVLIRG